MCDHPIPFEIIGQMFPNVRELDLRNTLLDDQGLRVLASQPFACNLTRLNIKDNEITTKGMQDTLVSFTSLRSLNVRGNKLDDAGFVAIAHAPFAGNLIELKIDWDLQDLAVVGNIKAFRNLKILAIPVNSPLGDEGLEMIAQAPCAANLIELNIQDNDITDAGLEDSIGAFTSLKALNIALNEDIGNAGLAAIARAPCAATLTWLDVLGTSVTDEGVQDNVHAFTNLKRFVR